MTSISTQAEPKYRTTFYLTEENKRLLDHIPRGKKTVLINQALSRLLTEMEKEKDRNKLVKMIADIEPVASKHSTEEIITALRDHDARKLFTND